MNRFLQLLFPLLTIMYVVDPESGGGEAEAETTAEDEQEPVSAGDEAWEALQSDEATYSEETAEIKDETPAAEQTESDQAEAKAEPEKKEEEKQGLTEDDLKPIESANQKTKERFEKVTQGYKEEKARAEALSSEVEKYKQSFDALKQLGFNDAAAAEDLVEFSAYRHILMTGDADKFKEIIGSQIKQFEAMHGKRVAVSTSVIDDYPDLKQKVDDLDLDETTATEVARSRKLTERATRQSQQNQQQEQTSQQIQQVATDAANEVDTLVGTWKNNDPDFTAVMPLLKEEIPEIRKLPPSQWVKTIDLMYKTIKKSLASAPKTSTPAPLRGNGHMTGSRQPQSMQEAVLMEMGMEG